MSCVLSWYMTCELECQSANLAPNYASSVYLSSSLVAHKILEGRRSSQTVPGEMKPFKISTAEHRGPQVKI